MFSSSLVLCAVLAATGCSAAKSAIGGVLSPKPPQVTVVNNVEATQAVEAKPRKRGRSLMEKVGIVTTATVVGAGVGALVGEATDSDTGGAAMLGAIGGALAGVAIAKE